MTISKPELKSIGDVYELHWSDEHIHMIVDHINESDTLTGSVTVSLNGNEKLEHIYQARLNLQSVTGKKQFSEALSKRLDQIDWNTAIEQACFKTIQSYYKGEPAVKVGNLPVKEKKRYRLYPWVIDESMTSLYGFGGGGKSYVAALTIVLIQTGESRLGINPIKGNSLILDWEACQEDWDERIRAIMKGMNIQSTEYPLYKRCYRTLSNEILEIQKLVLDNDIKFVVIDSVGMASELSEAYHSSSIQMLRAARSLKCSILLVDHKSKNNELFGSVYKMNEVRSAFDLESKKEENDNHLYLSIKHTKINNGPLSKTIGLEIEFQGTEDYTDSATFKKINVEDIPELAKNAPLKYRLIAALKQGQQSTQDLVTETGEKESTVRGTLNRYKETFKRFGLNWGLLTKEQEPPF